MLTYFQSLNILSDKELYELENILEEQVLAKNDFWIQEGKISNKVAVVKSGILAFSGIKNKRITYFAILKTSTADQRNKWIAKVEKLSNKV